MSNDSKLGPRARAIQEQIEASEYARVPVSDLVPWEKNPRRRMDEGSDRLRATIEAVGWGADVLVQKSTMRIIGGHLRLLAAQKLGLEVVPCKIMDVDDQFADDMALADNQAATFAENDPERLHALVAELDQSRREAIGFEQRDVDDLLRQIRSERSRAADVDEDGVPPLADPVTKLGDIIELGPHTIVCGDCTDPDVLTRVATKAQLVIADPPYNVSYVGKTSQKLEIDNDRMNDHAYREFLRKAIGAALDVLDEGRAWYVWHADVQGYNARGALLDLNQQIRQCLVWAKDRFVLGRQDYQRQHEPCLYGWKAGAAHVWLADRKQTTLLEHKRPSSSEDHPTMKPVNLIAELVENSSRPGETVVDMFLGSGSTLLACQITARVCAGVELDPRYCDVVVKRWEQLTSQKAVRTASLV